MNLFRNLSIRQRLLGSALLLCAGIVAMGAWTEISLRAAQAHAGRLLDTQASTARETTSILAALERVQRLEQSVMLNGSNANEAGEHHAQWKKTVAQTRELLKSVMSTPERAQELAAAAAGFEAHVKPLEDILQQVVDAKMDASAAFAYAGQAQADLDTARAVFNKWVDDTYAQVAASREARQRSEALQSVVRLAVLAALVVGVGALMFTLTRSIAQPLQKAMQFAHRIAQGDLSTDIDVHGQDEVAAFMRALGDMQQSLRTIVNRVRQSADSIHTASDEVATGNLDLSQRTEQTASNLQATAASMAQLNATVRHSTDAALQARDLAASAAAVAHRGGEMVGQVVQTMA
ncbi:MAG: methyl-accepting chemotaxis protein [Roseateles sp.]